ncbi:uncharacterized protein LOC142587852 [Dermacentor variabilis]|uniref:uncharacterized protein LOC142587852 n=1 Tax=Dermacentor variabilis TaxID=34621 RepID=UPI003F5BD371
MTSRPFASFHTIVELVVLTSIWSSHVLESTIYLPKETLRGFISTWHESTAIIEPRMALSAFRSDRLPHHGTPGVAPSCKTECGNGTKALCFTSPGWESCMCACVSSNDACPPKDRNACATGVACIWTFNTTMCLCTCESNGVTIG